MVDARDLKSLGPQIHTGSSPVPGTKRKESQQVMTTTGFFDGTANSF